MPNTLKEFSVSRFWGQVCELSSWYNPESDAIWRVLADEKEETQYSLIWYIYIYVYWQGPHDAYADTYDTYSIYCHTDNTTCVILITWRTNCTKTT